jgi:carbonic anhydrase
MYGAIESGAKGRGFLNLGIVMRILQQITVGASLVVIAGAALAAEEHAHWAYEGGEGPAHWGDMSKDFAACNGRHQSPVDLKGARKGDNEDVSLAWKPFAPVVLNNGHTIQAKAAEGNTTKFGDKTYVFRQMHFHHRSEHSVDGKLSPMEAHFVHEGPDGKLLVLGVLINEGAANPEIAKLWEVAPAKTGEATAKSAIDFAKLVPVSSDFYRYSGSLTTPPCSEIVEWVVFRDPITASKQQIETFARLYPANNRPVQALNDRSIVFGK